MGLSNYVPNSRISQAGVCTSTTRPATPYEGQVIYETDTNRVLVYDASAWVMIADTDSPPGLQLVKSQAIGTAVSSVTVTNAFSSEWDTYLVTVTGGAAAADYGFRMTLGSATSNYYYYGEYHNYPDTSTSGIKGSNASYWDAVGIMQADSLYAHITLVAPNLPKFTFFSATYLYGNQFGGRAAMGGYLADNTQHTSFTLYNPNTTMTGGTVRVYGYRNS